MTPAELAERNVGLVYAIAGDQWRVLGGEYDELVGDGMVGLMQAALRFDASRNDGPFSTYARSRVIGAMVDGYRKRHYNGHHGNGGRKFEVPLADLGAWEPTTCGADVQAIDRSTLGAVLERVGELSAEHRAVVHVAVTGGRFDALASRDGVTATRISQRLREARRYLRSAA